MSRRSTKARKASRRRNELLRYREVGYLCYHDSAQAETLGESPYDLEAGAVDCRFYINAMGFGLDVKTEGRGRATKTKTLHPPGCFVIERPDTSFGSRGGCGIRKGHPDALTRAIINRKVSAFDWTTQGIRFSF